MGEVALDWQGFEYFLKEYYSKMIKSALIINFKIHSILAFPTYLQEKRISLQSHHTNPYPVY
jgi:hypothetical protein